jgi:hypothetical protein
MIGLLFYHSFLELVRGDIISAHVLRNDRVPDVSIQWIF